MPFEDWLKDVATLNSVTYAEDVYGKESKVITPLYTDFACRLWKGLPKLMQGKDKEEKYIVTYKLYTTIAFNWGVRWDQVIINWKTLIIFWSQAAKWWETNHFIYNIKEDE